MTKYTTALFFFLSCYFFRCQAQDLNALPPASKLSNKYYLVLDKPGKVSRFRFYPGTQFTFKLTNDKRLYTGKIDAVHKRSIVVFNTEVPIRDIAKVRVVQRAPTGRLLYGVGNFLRSAGSLFTLIGGGNYLLTRDKENGKVTALAGLSALGVGQVFRGFNRRTYKINKNRQLKTIRII